MSYRSTIAVVALLLVIGVPRGHAAAADSTVRISFVRGEQLASVSRPGRTAADALRALFAGPTQTEFTAAFRTYIPATSRVRALSVRNGVATVDVNAPFVSQRTPEQLLASVSQLVQTLSAVSGVARVKLLVNGSALARTIDGVSLGDAITVHDLRTPNIPVPQPPSLKLRPPDGKTRAAQRRLVQLGYLVSGDDDGRFGPTTSEGLLAFQKVEGQERTGVLDAATQAALATATRPLPLTEGGAGKRAEILLDRQVALLIRDNRVVRAIAVSTGKPSTPTPPGDYRVYAKIPRWWSTPFREWLLWALPFVGGIAFHQFADVPVYPASHGCVRQAFAVARWTYDFADVGMPVKVIARS